MKERVVVFRLCGKCGSSDVHEETDYELAQTYPYYCADCDENLFGFEVEEIIDMVER